MGWPQWLIFAGYVTAALLCWRSWRALRRSDPESKPGVRQALATLGGAIRGVPTPQNQRHSAFWLLAGVCLSLLALNRLLSLDARLILLLRNLSVSGGWYADRRIFQLLTVTLLAAGVIVLLPRGRWIAEGGLSVVELTVALVGTVFLIGWVAIRACSFHYVDVLLGHTLAGFRIGGLVEFAVIGVVAVAAAVSPSRIRRAY